MEADLIERIYLATKSTCELIYRLLSFSFLNFAPEKFLCLLLPSKQTLDTNLKPLRRERMIETPFLGLCGINMLLAEFSMI